MAINLHPECRTRLVQIVADALTSATVSDQVMLNLGLYEELFPADDALPDRDEEVTGALELYIGERPISDFVVSELSRELVENYDFDTSLGEMSLLNLSLYGEADQEADRLISRLETLPWRYELLLPLPNDSGPEVLRGDGESHLRLSQDFGIFVPDESVVESYPLPEPPDGASLGLLAESLWVGRQPKLSAGRPTLIGNCTGYVAYLGTTRTVETFYSRVKSLCGLLIASRVVDPRGRGSTDSKRSVTVFRLTEQGREYCRPHTLPEEFSAQYQRITKRDRPSNVPEKFEEAIRDQAAKEFRGRASAVFDNETANERIMRASQWLFDSLANGRSLLSFIQTTVVLEILLGERAVSDLVGIGELLANRCAYLIADSTGEREEILRDFKRAYHIRSRIVHEGKARLNRRERRALHDLRGMCYRALREEMKLVESEWSNSS